MRKTSLFHLLTSNNTSILSICLPVHCTCTRFVCSVLGDRTMQVSVRRLALYPLGAVRSGQIRCSLLSPVPRLLSPRARTLFSETGVWEKDYRTETRRRVEEWWHPRIMAQWQKDAVEQVRLSSFIQCLSR